MNQTQFENTMGLIFIFTYLKLGFNVNYSLLLCILIVHLRHTIIIIIMIISTFIIIIIVVSH